MSYDVVVIGSGFGGSVAALRLAEKGYSVAVLEAGKRWEDKDFPKTSWRLRKFLWAPALGFYGIQRIILLRGDEKGAGVLVLAGAGVVAARSTTPTPSTARSTRSTTTLSGAISPTGKPNWRRITTPPSACSGWSPMTG